MSLVVMSSRVRKGQEGGGVCCTYLCCSHSSPIYASWLCVIVVVVFVKGCYSRAGLRVVEFVSCLSTVGLVRNLSYPPFYIRQIHIYTNYHIVTAPPRESLLLSPYIKALLAGVYPEFWLTFDHDSSFFLFLFLLHCNPSQPIKRMALERLPWVLIHLFLVSFL